MVRGFSGTTADLGVDEYGSHLEFCSAVGVFVNLDGYFEFNGLKRRQVFIGGFSLSAYVWNNAVWGALSLGFGHSVINIRECLSDKCLEMHGTLLLC